MSAEVLHKLTIILKKLLRIMKKNYTKLKSGACGKN